MLKKDLYIGKRITKKSAQDIIKVVKQCNMFSLCDIGFDPDIQVFSFWHGLGYIKGVPVDEMLKLLEDISKDYEKKSKKLNELLSRIKYENS